MNIEQITQIVRIVTTFPQRSEYQFEEDWIQAADIWTIEFKNFAEDIEGLIPELKTMITQINSQTENINIVKTIVESAVNYKGEWSAQTYNLNESVSIGKYVFISKIDNNNTNPLTDETNSWLEKKQTGNLATLDKSFAVNEAVLITLDSEILSAPIVSVVKEEPQIDITNNTWDINVGEYEQESSDLDIVDGSISIVPSINNYDILGASYDNKSFDANSYNLETKGITFSPDGIYMYLVGGFAIEQFILFTAWDVDTSTYIREYITSDSDLTGIKFNPQGTKMILVADGDNKLYEYNLSTAWNISTLSFVTDYDTYTGVSANSLMDFGFKDDGTKLYLMDHGKIHQFTLPTPYSLVGIIYDSLYFNYGGTPFSFIFNPDGTALYVTQYLRNVYKHPLNTPWDISTIQASSETFSYDSAVGSYQHGLDLSPDGLKLYTTGFGGSNKVYQFSIGSIIYPTNTHFPAVTTLAGEISTPTWTNLKDMIISETLDSQTINYAISTDNKTTFSIAKTTEGIRNIVRDNSGTWEYNSNTTYASETWSAATTNNMYKALSEAMSIGVNKMPKSQIDLLLEDDYFTLEYTLDLATILHTNSNSTTPDFLGLTLNFDANSKYPSAKEFVDYEWEKLSDTSIAFKALTTNNLKVRIS